MLQYQSPHRKPRRECVKREGRGEEGLFWGGGRCWGWCRLTGGGQECDLAQTHSDCCTVRGGVAKISGIRQDSIKEQEQVTETETSVMSYYWLGSRRGELYYICQSTFSDRRYVLKRHVAAGYKGFWWMLTDSTVTFSELREIGVEICSFCRLDMWPVHKIANRDSQSPSVCWKDFVSCLPW